MGPFDMLSSAGRRLDFRRLALKGKNSAFLGPKTAKSKMGLEGPNRMLFGLKVELNVSLSSKIDVVPTDFMGRKNWSVRPKNLT